MKVWCGELRETKPNPLSSPIFNRLNILAETFEEAEKKLRKYMKDNFSGLDLYISKIELMVEINIE